MRRLLVVSVVCLTACGPGEPELESVTSEPGVVEVVARGLSFEMPSEIPSGWTTLRFRNESPMIHFAVIERVPEGQGLVSQQEEVAPVFQEGMDLLAAGEVDTAMAKFGELPAWFGEIVFFGGPGLTSPGRTSEATVFLEPGTYLLECYVKTDGIFHSYNPDPGIYGMISEFQVTEEESGLPEPSASLELDISSGEGIRMTGAATPGEHTVAVRFGDQITHENFVGHDVHLVRIGEDQDLAALEAWMDWTQPMGLITPAPAEFLGGLNEMPAGATGYFTVTLEAGEYAWIAEVPGSRAKGMLTTFLVE